MNGEVIAVNSFGDFSSRGPGIYGSVNILEAKNLIGKAIKTSIVLTLVYTIYLLKSCLLCQIIYFLQNN